LAGELIHKPLESILSTETRYAPAFAYVSFLKKANQYMLYLESISNLLIQNYTNQQNFEDKRSRGMLTFHLKTVITYIGALEEKYKFFSSLLLEATADNFEVAEVTEFRERCHRFVVQGLKMHSFVDQLQANLKENVHRGSRIGKTTDAIQMFSSFEKTMTQDFTEQLHFKCSEYPNLTI
jgi:hypothetical protein